MNDSDGPLRLKDVDLSDVIMLDRLHAGRSFGVMEMMECLTYQSSVVADPWTEIYTITKYDLVRHTSKSILHALFQNYKARLTDNRLVRRLQQNYRWNCYKRGLLEEIRNRRSGRRGTGRGEGGSNGLTRAPTSSG